MNKLKNRGNFIAKYGCNALVIKTFAFPEYPSFFLREYHGFVFIHKNLAIYVPFYCC